MTCLIQIGTRDVDYLIDCFPVVDLIKTELKIVLEDRGVLKYVFGEANDFLWLKRYFFINVVNAVDVQLLVQQILKTGEFENVSLKIPMAIRRPSYHANIGPRDRTTSLNEAMTMQIRAGQTPMGFEKLVNLFYPNEGIQKDAQVADFRPRPFEDGNYKRLLKYARDDVHTTKKTRFLVVNFILYIECILIMCLFLLPVQLLVPEEPEFL